MIRNPMCASPSYSPNVKIREAVRRQRSINMVCFCKGSYLPLLHMLQFFVCLFVYLGLDLRQGKAALSVLDYINISEPGGGGVFFAAERIMI